ncbi:MAG TPA: outer membrane beta-barrel protein [Bacteroidales bacterium]|nr:outer membrane beta-barrel protein [Bacteroidales bacterium]
MKRTLLLLTAVLTFLLLNITSNAQFNYIGGGIALATGGEYEFKENLYYNNTFGIDLRASYNINKKYKLVPDIKFYLPKKESFEGTGGESKTTVVAFNLNLHYITNPRKDYKLYLLAGAHVGGWIIKDNHIPAVGPQDPLDINEFKIVPGGNVGGGMQFNVGNRTLFYAEIKYVISKAHQLVFSPGLIYEF